MRITVIFVLGLLAVSRLGFAQAPKVLLRGAVLGGSARVPGADVFARRGATVRRTVTNASGVYGFASLAAGGWTITVSMPGFVSAIKHVAVRGDASAPTRLDFTLALPALAGELPGSQASKFRVTAVVRAGVPGSTGIAAPARAATAPAPPTALAVNGSQDNAAASPYAVSPAFGNHRPSQSSLFNGGVGLTLDTSALDARSYSLTGQPTPKPGYANLTGLLQIGGPLLIPRLFNANAAPFFSVMYQKQTVRSVTTTPALVPTLAERSGNLSAVAEPISDPANDRAFPGNRVPVSPQAAALLRYYPLPNLVSNGAFNYEVPLASAQHADNLQLRVDDNVGRRDSLAGTFGLQSVRKDAPNIFGFTDRGGNLGLNADLRWRHVFSRDLSGTFGFAYSRERVQLTPYFANREDVSALAGIAGNDPSPANWGPPALSFSNGLAGLSDGQAMRNRNQTAAFSFAGDWNHYGHNLAFGADLRRLQFNYWQQEDGRGSFTFNGAASGNALADFLLGVPDAATLAFGNADKYFRQRSYDAFVTDHWIASDALSFDLGLRWEFATPVSERYDRLVNLDVAPGFGAVAPVLASAPMGPLTGDQLPAALLRADPRGLEPRLGLAWSPFASAVVVRAGYGIYYDTSVYPEIALRLAQQAPLSTSLNLVNSAAQPLTLASGFLAKSGAQADTFAVAPDFRPGYVQTWQASVQQALPAGMTLVLTYLGNKGTHSQQEFLPNTYAPGAANPCPACPSGFLYLTSDGNSTYESGQAMLQRRYHHGLAWKLTYTYAHAIDDAILGGSGANQGQSTTFIAQNWRDIDGERGNSSFDQRHKLTLTAQYSTGVGLGTAAIPGWVRSLYRDWTVTSQLTTASGLPLTPTTSLLTPSSVYATLRPDLTGDPVSAPIGGQFLNPGAYVLPAAGAWGDAARNSITGPDVFSLDGALQREFPLSSQFNAILRVDATNVLNHVTYPSWVTLFGSPQFGLPLSANPMRSLQVTLRITF